MWHSLVGCGSFIFANGLQTLVRQLTQGFLRYIEGKFEKQSDCLGECPEYLQKSFLKISQHTGGSGCEIYSAAICYGARSFRDSPLIMKAASGVEELQEVITRLFSSGSVEGSPASRGYRCNKRTFSNHLRHVAVNYI